MLNYWHPILSSRDLPSNRAVGITLAGRSLALFRSADGRIGAVADQCPHRRMKLSLGRVEHGKLICPYHGWSFTCDGEGESPSAPKTQACITSYACAEASGAIWVKARESKQELPTLTMDGLNFAGTVFNKIRAPIELVIDNFSEIEHTVATHPDFGFDSTRAAEAVVELESSDDSITVRNKGPAKMPPLDTRLAIGIRQGDYFHSNYTFRFDPPRSSVTHLWSEPRTGRERGVKYHVFHYFVPQDEAVTTVVSFGFLKIDRPLLRHLGGPGGWLFCRKLRRTVEEDAFLLENLADQSTNLEGMKLSRFDSILGLTRERLRRIYFSGPDLRSRTTTSGRS
jgi:phenylpropionate dioxygenase-like ring-hydroxylating dioxygenase large terminal subunit